jgi:hypothetical protein
LDRALTFTGKDLIGDYCRLADTASADYQLLVENVICSEIYGVFEFRNLDRSTLGNAPKHVHGKAFTIIADSRAGRVVFCSEGEWLT